MNAVVRVPSAKCVVFAYSEVGVRCLKVLISGGAKIALVVTHEDDPTENRWYGSVAETAADYGLPVIYPADPKDPALLLAVESIAPDFIFSFFYRYLLSNSILRSASRAALNMHGSYLPDYRGRAPVNWALIHGETQLGATLHHMVARADAGDIVGQCAVPILEDDDAREVFNKVVVAAEIVLSNSWPKLLVGTAPRIAQDINAGRYFGRRRPENGLINLKDSARTIHNLVRAVAPPYPGAYILFEGQKLFFYKTRVLHNTENILVSQSVRFTAVEERWIIECADGSCLWVLAAALNDVVLDVVKMARRFASMPVTFS